MAIYLITYGDVEEIACFLASFILPYMAPFSGF